MIGVFVYFIGVGFSDVVIDFIICDFQYGNLIFFLVVNFIIDFSIEGINDVVVYEWVVYGIIVVCMVEVGIIVVDFYVAGMDGDVFYQFIGEIVVEEGQVIDLNEIIFYLCFGVVVGR